MAATTGTDDRGTTHGRIQVLPGVIDLLVAAVGNRADQGFDCLLNEGDLGQMAAQKRFLLDRGFEVGQQDAFPALRAVDFPRALQLLFTHRVEGWWNLERAFVENQVCTADQFREAMRTAVEK